MFWLWGLTEAANLRVPFLKEAHRGGSVGNPLALGEKLRLGPDPGFKSGGSSSVVVSQRTKVSPTRSPC